MAIHNKPQPSFKEIINQNSDTHIRTPSEKRTNKKKRNEGSISFQFLEDSQEFIDNEENYEQFKLKLINLNHKEKLFAENIDNGRLFFQNQQQTTLLKIRKLTMDLDLLNDEIHKKEEQMNLINYEFEKKSHKLKSLNIIIDEIEQKRKKIQNSFELEKIINETKNKELKLLLNESEKLNNKIATLKTNIFEIKKNIKFTSKNLKSNNDLKVSYIKNINKLKNKVLYLESKLNNLKNVHDQKNSDNYELCKSIKHIKNRLQQENSEVFRNETKYQNLNSEIYQIKDQIFQEEENSRSKNEIIREFKNEEKNKENEMFQLEKKIKEHDWILEQKKQKLDDLMKYEKDLTKFLQVALKKFEKKSKFNELKNTIEETNFQIERDSIDIIKMLKEKQIFLNKL